jgi:hypothetical protein
MIPLHSCSVLNKTLFFNYSLLVTKSSICLKVWHSPIKKLCCFTTSSKAGLPPDLRVAKMVAFCMHILEKKQLILLECLFLSRMPVGRWAAIKPTS